MTAFDDKAVEAVTVQDNVNRLLKVLRWYGEQARLARLIHSEGDKGRHALAADGGSNARDAVEAYEACRDSIPPPAAPNEVVETLWRLERASRAMLTGIEVHNNRKIDRFLPIEGPVPYELADATRHATKTLAALASRPDGADDLKKAVDYADRAHSRLLRYASLAHSGKAELNGREMARQVWGAFAEFNELNLPYVAELRAKAKQIAASEGAISETFPDGADVELAKVVRPMLPEIVKVMTLNGNHERAVTALRTLMEKDNG